MYLFPVINEVWEAKQNSVFSELVIENLWLPGDGRCDSPRHSAKYGTYTMINQLSNKTADFQIVQVSKVTSSNAIEREGFKRCMENIHDRGATVKVVATDHHVSIWYDMKKNFPHLQHQFDVWHVAKMIPKKSQKRPRGKNVVNFSPGSSQSLTIFGGVQTLVRGIRLSYVRSGSPLSPTQPTSTHGTVPTCIMNVPTHPSLGRRQGQSSGFALVPLHMRVGFDKTLLEDIEQLTLNCHTGTLEVYHSLQVAALLMQGNGCSHTVSSPRSQC